MTDFHRVARATLVLTLMAGCHLHAQVNVTTQHNDIGRTGQNTKEVILTPANVSSGSFGKLFSVAVDGPMYVQPLYLAGVSIPGAGTHNVVFVATEHDSVYALDADQALPAPLWQVSLLDTAHGATAGAIPEPSSDTGCTDIKPEFGVTGTPVIDPSTGTIYVVSVSSENGYPVQRMHALDVTTGSEKFGGPTVIKASVQGTGVGSSNGILNFDPKWALQRAGLLLINNTVYAGFAAHCDYGPFHGWILGYNAATLAQTSVFTPSPNGYASGFWASGAGLSADTSAANPRMFAVTGNGTHDATLPYGTNTMDYGDDILQLTLNSAGVMQVTDAFTPFNQAALSSVDGDVGSGGILILPDQAGAYPHLGLQIGKSGDIYIVNRENLGGYNTSTNNIVQEVDHQVSGLWGIPAYWNANVYIWASGGFLKQFIMSNGVLSSAAVFQGTEYTSSLGLTPSVSANGNTNGIVWAVDSSANPEILTAHNALNVSTTLYSSAVNPTRDNPGPPTKFQVPTVVNGKVYVAGNGVVSAFGIIPANDFTLSASPASVTILQGGTVSDSLAITALNGFSGTVTLSASGLPTGVSAAFVQSSSGSATLTLTAASSASVGTFPVTVLGTSGTLAHSVSLSVQVLGSTTQPDFTLTGASPSINLVPGSLATTGLILTPVNNYSGTPSLTVSGLPSGITPSFLNVSATYYILTLTSVSTAPLGIYPLTVSGTSGTLVRTAALTLTVAASPNYTSVELQPNNTFKCLTVSGNSTTAGASVVQSTCTAASGQLWNVTALGGSTYEISSPSTGLALSVVSNGLPQLAMNSYASLSSQQWLLQGTPWGFYYILNSNSGQCLDVAGAGAADGTLVDETGCTGATNQFWSVFTPVRSITQVNLSPFFNVDGIVTDGTVAANGGLTGGYVLSSSALGTTATWGGNTFSFGAANTLDAVTSVNVSLPAGQFSSLQVLAIAVNGGQVNQSFVITYTDGTTTTIQQSVSDCAASSGYAGESKAIVMPYIVAPNGSRYSGTFIVYGYSLALNNSKTVQSVSLPRNNQVDVFAMSLVK